MRIIFLISIMMGNFAYAGDPSSENCGEPEPPLIIRAIDPDNNQQKEEASKWDPAADARWRMKTVLKMNDYFKTSSGSQMVGLRSQLNARGVSPDKSFVVDMIPISSKWKMIILISSQRAVYSFDTNGKEILGWEDISSTWKTSPYCREIDDGFRVVDKNT